MPNNQTHEEVEGYIDPGGDIPAWAINAVQRQAPYYTVIGLQRMVKNLPKFAVSKLKNRKFCRFASINPSS
jgi:hypothetical protein